MWFKPNQRLIVMHIERTKLLNPLEAPEGYKAILKSNLPKTISNICNFCDWRKTCQKSTTDFEKHNHRCMSYPIISNKTGKTIERQDGCSVVFKKYNKLDY